MFVWENGRASTRPNSRRDHELMHQAVHDPAELAAAEQAPVKVSFDSIRWEVDFGGGITQRFAAYDEAIAAAQRAAASEGRDVHVVD
jgi:hypothetical protein